MDIFHSSLYGWLPKTRKHANAPLNIPICWDWWTLTLIGDNGSIITAQALRRLASHRVWFSPIFRWLICLTLVSLGSLRSTRAQSYSNTKYIHKCLKKKKVSVKSPRIHIYKYCVSFCRHKKYTSACKTTQNSITLLQKDKTSAVTTGVVYKTHDLTSEVHDKHVPY